MYNSSIFLKNSSTKGSCDPSFFEPIREPLSPHHAKYSKQSGTVQFVPNFNNVPIRQHETNVFSQPVQK